MEKGGRYFFVVWCVAPVLVGSVVSIGTLVVDLEQGRRFPSAVPMFLQCTWCQSTIPRHHHGVYGMGVHRGLVTESVWRKGGR